MNAHDWLGPGVYFWMGGYQRAYEWARTQKKAKSPAVVCALIDLGHCLNLCDVSWHAELAHSFQDLSLAMSTAGIAMPANSPSASGFSYARNLDCAVIAHLHFRRLVAGHQPYDTVLGAFDEGARAFPGSDIRTRSHVQIAVRSSANIIAVFRT